MALGIDNKLKSSMTPSLSPKAPSYPQIGDRTVTNANNNIMARQSAQQMRDMEDINTQGILNGLAQSQAMNSLSMQSMGAQQQNYQNEAAMRRQLNKFDPEAQILQYLLG